MKKWALLGLAFCAGGLGAAEAPSLLEWESCRAEFARHNPDYQASRLSEERARLATLSTLGGFLPRVNASASAGQSGNWDPFTRDPGRLSASLSASQDLFSGFSRAGALDRARASLLLARAQAQAQRAALSFDLKQAFVRLLYSQQQLVLAEGIAARRAENVDLVALRFEAGRENKGAMLQTRAQSAQSSYEARSAARALRRAAEDLEVLLGRPPTGALRVRGGLEVPALPAKGVDELLVEETPAVLQARARKAQQEAALLGTWSAFLPTLSLSAGASSSGSWESGLGAPGWNAGASLSVPIFSGWSGLRDRDGARAALLEAVLALEGLRRGTAAQLRAVLDQATDAVEQVQVRDSFDEASRIRAQIARAQYSQGLLGFEEWDRIEGDLISAQKLALTVRRDAVLARSAWDRELGREIQ